MGFDLDCYSICPNCHRQRWVNREFKHGEPCEAKLWGAVLFYVHDFYGCDTGCCGHSIIIEATDGEVLYRDFEFTHGVDEVRDAAERVAAKLGIRIDRDRCDPWDFIRCPF